MSQPEELQDTQSEVKQEENAPINIKVGNVSYHVHRWRMTLTFLFLLVLVFIDLRGGNVKVVSSTGDEVYFKIKRSTKLSKLQAAYANKVGKDVGSIRYVLFFRVAGRV
jgi:hypothetical protein